MEAFRSDNPELGTGAMAFEQALESCRTNINWMKQNEPKIRQWLLEATGGEV